MTSFFRGALNLIQGEAGGGADGTFHPLVGKELQIGNARLRVKSVIAEGGFAIVFSAQDQNGKLFALKQQIANDNEAVYALANEVGVMEELRGHPNIVTLHNVSKSKASNGGTEYLMLLELCSGGSVVDTLKMCELEISQVLRIFYAACKAVKHMHCREKPITHRDIKVENLLISAEGIAKLCDFGSSTRTMCHPDDSWKTTERTALIEEMQKNTTPMYRAPEIQDEYMNLPVGPQQDIWALGCVLFYLCHRVHPFEDSSKLRIVNAKYRIPPFDRAFTMFIPLIQSCLQINPTERPTITDLVERTEALAAALDMDANAPVCAIKPPPESQRPAFATHTNNRAGGRTENDVSQQASAVFGALKGQGLSLFKNLKDRSAAVVQTVQATYGSSGPDIVALTSRMMLAPIAEHVPEALAAQAEEALRNFASDMGRPYVVVNLSYRNLKCQYPNPPLESVITLPGLSPSVKYLINISQLLTQFLRQNPNGFVVFYGFLPHCSLLAATLMIYNQLVSCPMKALELISERRKGAISLPPSFHRSLDIICKVVRTPRSSLLTKIIHNCRVSISNMTMEPVPLFNRTYTGCRPFAEVYVGGTKLWSNVAEYDTMRVFENPEKNVELVFNNILACADVTIIVYHSRWSKMQNKQLHIPMFSFGFHSNFCDRNQNCLTFRMGDLDVLDDDLARFPEGFRVVLNLSIDPNNRGFNTPDAPEFTRFEPDSVSAKYLVDGIIEHETVRGEFETGVQPRPPVPPPPQPNVDFFSTLSWGEKAPEAKSKSELPAPAPAPSQQSELTDLFGFQSVNVNPVQPPSPVVQRPQGISQKTGADDYDIRVGKHEVDDDYAKYQFDCDKPVQHETPILGDPSPLQSSASNTTNSEIDLLGLGELNIASSKSSISQAACDPFADLLGYSTPKPTPAEPQSNIDLFGDFTTAPATVPMHRNVSAPTLPQQNGKSNTFDPFAEFLNSAPVHSLSNPGSKPGSAGNSGTNTPKPSRPNYSRSAFDSINPNNTGKPKVNADSFGDLLSGHGFAGSSFNSAPKTMADMRRAEEIKELDPIEIKIRDWTKGKEKNIRALLGSLNDVLWEGADRWQQPPMGELLNASQVKKWYRKACLVVHPDKQTGQPQEELARAVFTQLNEAWTAFEQAGSPSLT